MSRALLQIALVARTRTERVKITIGAGPATVAVVADSHGRPHPRAYALLEQLQPAAILHAGDIGGLDLLDELARIAPTHAVRGNVDGRDPQTPDELVVDITRDGRCEVRILMTHIGVAGPRLGRPARVRAKELQAGLVVCGHSHLPLIVGDAEIAAFNPGSIGPRRFRLPTTFGVLDIGSDGFTLGHLDCDTGEAWRPPAGPS